ncbi:MAG: hypothetical protein ACJ8I3_22660 [Paraburkholderia graminis]
MIDTRKEIERHLSALRGLNVSGISHAANMLTMQFGSLRQVTNFKGAVKQVGEWALHIQCNWQIERTGEIIATQNALSGTDEEAHRAAEQLDELLVKHGLTIVEDVLANKSGGVILSMSEGLRVTITPAGIPDEEDWRFFSPAPDAKHFVIEGGKIDPYSFS